MLSHISKYIFFIGYCVVVSLKHASLYVKIMAEGSHSKRNGTFIS